MPNPTRNRPATRRNASLMRGCWINREAATWTHPQLQPDLQFDTLTGLADWLDANLDAAAPRSI